MTCMQHVKGAEGNTNSFAVGLELFDVIEYHKSSRIQYVLNKAFLVSI
jgi:hypothetical protein